MTIRTKEDYKKLYAGTDQDERADILNDLRLQTEAIVELEKERVGIELIEECRRLKRYGEPMAALRLYREKTSCGLREAKTIIDSL